MAELPSTQRPSSPRPSAHSGGEKGGPQGTQTGRIRTGDYECRRACKPLRAVFAQTRTAADVTAPMLKPAEQFLSRLRTVSSMAGSLRRARSLRQPAPPSVSSGCPARRVRYSTAGSVPSSRLCMLVPRRRATMWTSRYHLPIGLSMLYRA